MRKAFGFLILAVMAAGSGCNEKPPTTAAVTTHVGTQQTATAHRGVDLDAIRGKPLADVVAANHLDKYRQLPDMNQPPWADDGMLYLLNDGDLHLTYSGHPLVVRKAEFWPSDESPEQRWKGAMADWDRWLKAHSSAKPPTTTAAITPVGTPQTVTARSEDQPATAPTAASALTEEAQVVAEIKEWGGVAISGGDTPDGAVGQVFLGGTRVTDAGLEHLKGLPHLECLLLSHTNVTDAGLKHLEGLKELRELHLAYAKVTDAGLIHLNGLKQLQTLSLLGTNVAGAGLENLTGLNQLQELDLSATKVAGAGLEHLKGLKQLTTLFLNNTEVTDAGLEHLTGLKQLQNLELDDTNITDAGLEHLKGLVRLQTLYLHDTKVTDQGVEKLQEALPKCKIYH